jgi:hypothetical protein
MYVENLFDRTNVNNIINKSNGGFHQKAVDFAELLKKSLTVKSQFHGI